MTLIYRSSIKELQDKLKVRLRWFWVVLQCPSKFVLFLFSINTLRRIIYHWIAIEECYIMI